MKTLFNKEMINKNFAKLMILVLVAVLYAAGLSFLVNRSADTIAVNAIEIDDKALPIAAAMSESLTDEAEEFLIDEKYPKRYATRSVDLLEDTDNLAVITDTIKKRDLIYIVEANDEYSKIMTEDGIVGYMNSEYITNSLAKIFDYEKKTMYSDGELELLDAPSDKAKVLETLEKNTEIKITGTNDLQYWKAKYNGEVVYVDKDHLMEEEEIEIIETPEVKSEVATAPQTEATEATKNTSYNGAVLSPSAGTIMGPSGKETYYNLDMSGVVSIMKGAGYDYEYWVRDDGVKMYGDYVMAACGFSVRPRGTTVETSLGTAICADTGGFAYGNPMQIDIAVNW